MQRILVIDDDPTVTSVLKRGLAYEGFAVDTATTGPQGLTIARDYAPDLVILDVMLPGIDGFEVLRRLRSADKDLPVLALHTERHYAGPSAAAAVVIGRVSRKSAQPSESQVDVHQYAQHRREEAPDRYQRMGVERIRRDERRECQAAEEIWVLSRSLTASSAAIQPRLHLSVI